MLSRKQACFWLIPLGLQALQVLRNQCSSPWEECMLYWIWRPRLIFLRMIKKHLRAGTEAWRQGLGRLKEASSSQLGSRTSLLLSGRLAAELCTAGSTSPAAAAPPAPRPRRPAAAPFVSAGQCPRRPRQPGPAPRSPPPGAADSAPRGRRGARQLRAGRRVRQEGLLGRGGPGLRVEGPAREGEERGGGAGEAAGSVMQIVGRTGWVPGHTAPQAPWRGPGGGGDG